MMKRQTICKTPFSGNRCDSLSIESNKFYEDQIFSGIEWDEGHKINDTSFFDCTFEQCKFYKISFIGCTFENCIFKSSDLALASIKSTFFAGVKFIDTKLSGIDWTDAATPLDVNFNRCVLDYSGFVNVDLRNTEIIECQLREADFSKADLSKTNCSFSDFSGAKFFNTNLTRADLTNASNYSIRPDKNNIYKAIFSIPEVLSLLNEFDIIIE